ncbi:GGDEF domain-containing protein [Modestobacter sp. VKM Ac-2979]|uniref:GGDEF domain-containing protein n=1 Tax=unclassified Modestobacter TaxID=2643866 RepID=UPI0022AB8F34|nr:MULTISPECIES: GGDEF domain-containing protein [unclassified Modestobacter]MCZ2812244.1 GGDEF domain-containing protein [Modestobacter sp. VKM Ac-2979]MCZ2841134.1 GGDEF domain-containing protein [Modestobacter sp. VKM Ac-2980]
MRPPPAESRAMRWLRGDAQDRTRFADMYLRFRRPYVFGGAVSVAKVVGVPWFGLPLVALFLAGGLTMVGAVVVQRRLRRPSEPVVAAAVLLLQLNLAVVVLLTGGATSPYLVLLTIPLFSQAVCFRPPVLATGAALTFLFAGLAVLFADTLPAVPAAPSTVGLVAFGTVLLCLTTAARYLASADLHSRDGAVLDPMTGLYNRLTLADRFVQAQEREAATGGSLALVMCDVDHFKSVNDTYGHARGDAVLQELADRLRTGLRSTDVAYRIGGEEFVVLLPGRDAAGAQRVAERMRAAVADTPVAGLRVTVSAGAVSAPAAQASLPELLWAADAALYAAKDAGRNRVVTGVPGQRLVIPPHPAAAHPLLVPPLT